MYNSWIIFINVKHLNLEMHEQAVDSPDDVGVEQFVYDKNNSELSSWRYCNSTTLPRSEDVFSSKLHFFWYSSSAV